MLFSSDEDVPAIVKIIGPAVIPSWRHPRGCSKPFMFNTYVLLAYSAIRFLKRPHSLVLQSSINGVAVMIR
jgi:hypothetical protein